MLSDDRVSRHHLGVRESAGRFLVRDLGSKNGTLYEGSLVTEYGGGTHHDAPSAANREVPIIVRVPGVAAGALPAGVTPLQIAPTLAALLGVAPPAAAQAAPLPLD